MKLARRSNYAFHQNNLLSFYIDCKRVTYDTFNRIKYAVIQSGVGLDVVNKKYWKYII